MENSPSSKPCVLVVDDSPIFTESIKEYLQESYTVLSASNGAEGLKIAFEEPQPDLILLDILMPEMDGYEVMRQLQAEEATRDIPVIFITAISDKESELTGFDLGAVDFITKPLNPSIVKARVQTHIALREAREKLEKQNQALQNLNQTLEQRVDEAVRKTLEQELMLVRQSRFAAMGEMIGNIAHQWRQPLSVLNLLLSNILDAYDYQEMNRETLAEAISKGGQLIDKMSETIDDFRNFFKPDKEKINFNLLNSVQNALDILSGCLISRGIAVRLESDEDIAALGYPNEYSQVLLNILTNSKEALEERNVAGGEILVRVFVHDGAACVTVRDNAGGIPENILPKIFDPYYTTKEKGTGIGLYMSKVIIQEHMNGKLMAHNVEGGVEFTVICPCMGVGCATHNCGSEKNAE